MESEGYTDRNREVERFEVENFPSLLSPSFNCIPILLLLPVLIVICIPVKYQFAMQLSLAVSVAVLQGMKGGLPNLG